MSRKKQRRMTPTFYVVITLIFALITFAILAIIPKSIAIEMDVFAKRVNFSLASAIESGKEISLLHSGLWAKSVSIESFQRLELTIAELDSGENLPFVNPITISSDMRNGRVTFISDSSDLFLQDVVCDSGSRISIVSEEENVSFLVKNSRISPYQMLSLGQEVSIGVQACQVFDDAQNNLTQLFGDEKLVGLHEISRALRLQGKNGKLSTFVEISKREEGDQIQFILELPVQNLNFAEDVHQISDKTTRSTIDSISIRRRLYLDNLNFKSQDPGDLEITSVPNRFAIYNLSKYGKGLKVRAQSRLKSLQIGQGILKTDVIPKYLSIVTNHPVSAIAITWLGYIFTIVIPFILKLNSKAKTK